MTLTVEDGTGITGADAYISLADAEALYLDRNGTAWSGTDALKEAAIRRATAFVDTLNFIGTPVGLRAQALEWPRKNATDRNGFDIPEDEVPEEVVNATGLFAFAELETPGILSPTVDRAGAVKSEKVGPISIEYAGNPATVDFQRQVVTGAMDLLKALIVGRGTAFLSRA